MNIIKKTISGIIEITRGMLTIGKHAFRKPITLEYPEVKPNLNARAKGRLALMRDEAGNPVCKGCGLCARVCPCGDLIQLEVGKDDDGKKCVNSFAIDLGRCIYCGNCTEVCASGALVFVEEFEIADFSRESLVFDKDMLLLTKEQSDILRKKREKDL